MEITGKIVRFNAQTSGRDKLCRVFQYGSKLGWWYSDEVLKRPDLVHKLKTLETTFSATRKVLRLGKSLDMIQGALKSIQLEDKVWRLTITLTKLNQACYLLIDHFIWASKIGLIKADSKKWAKVAARFWLVTILFNLTRNIYDIINILQRHFAARCVKQNGVANGDVNHRHGDHHQSLIKGNLPVWLDTARNSSDLILPMSTLNYISISPGVQGLMGMISSIISIITVWNTSLKLVPS